MLIDNLDRQEGGSIGRVSIGVEECPLIGVQKGPLWRCGEQARGGVAFQLAQPTRACVSGVFMPVF